MKQLIIFPFLGSSHVCFDLMWERRRKNWLQFLQDTEQVKKKKKRKKKKLDVTEYHPSPVLFSATPKGQQCCECYQEVSNANWQPLQCSLFKTNM